jgi:hypothetical protein
MPLCFECSRYEKRAPCKDTQCKACEPVPTLLPTEWAGLDTSTNDLRKLCEALRMPGSQSRALEAFEQFTEDLNLAAAKLRKAIDFVSPPLQEQGGSSNDAALPGLLGEHKRSTAAPVASVEEQAAQQQNAPVQAGHVVEPGQAEHAAQVQDEHVAAPVQAVRAAPQCDTQMGAQAVQVPNEPGQASPETKSDAASGSGNKQMSEEEEAWSKRGWEVR